MPTILGAVSLEPIQAVRVSSSQAAFPAMERHSEAASQTFKKGVPLMLDGGGNMVEWTTALANTIYGVNAEPPHNLTVAATAQDLSEGSPQNQPSGITTPVGAWPRDGKIEVYQANGQTVFSISLKSGQTFVSTDIQAGTIYGLDKDATTGFWFMDKTITAGNKAVLVLLGLDSSSPNDGVNGSRVFVQFASTRRYFV